MNLSITCRLPHLLDSYKLNLPPTFSDHPRQMTSLFERKSFQIRIWSTASPEIKPMRKCAHVLRPPRPHTHTQKVSIFTRFSWGCLWRFRYCGTWRRVGGCAVPDVQPSPYCIHLRESRGSQVHTFVPPTPSLMVTTVPDTHVTETPYINISPNHPAFGILHGTRDPWRGRYSVLSNRPETLN